MPEKDEYTQYAVIDYMGTWNIGAYIVASDDFVLLGAGFRSQVIEIIEKTLRVKSITFKVMSEDLVGVFVVANMYGVLLPRDASDDEYFFLKERLGEEVIIERVNIKKIRNALGNLIAVNNKRALIAENLFKKNAQFIRIIEDTLNVEVVPVNLQLGDVVASYVFFNDRGLVASPLLSDEEIETIKTILGFPSSRVIISTINMGNPIIRSGLVANNKGILVGNKTSGVELARIYNTLL